MNHHDTNEFLAKGTDWSRVNQWLLWLGLATAVIWLVTKHGAHLLEIALFLFILACPLMHIFGHGAHGHGGHRGPGGDERSNQPSVPSTSNDTAPRRDS